MPAHLNVAAAANERMRVGHRLQFYCDDEYTLDGSEEVECLPTGKWNADFPTCEGKFNFIGGYSIYIDVTHRFNCIFELTHLFRLLTVCS